MSRLLLLQLLIYSMAVFKLLRQLAQQRRSVLLGGDDWLGAPLAVPEVCDRSDAWML